MVGIELNLFQAFIIAFTIIISVSVFTILGLIIVKNRSVSQSDDPTLYKIVKLYKEKFGDKNN